jgi:hypothetical protein
LCYPCFLSPLLRLPLLSTPPLSPHPSALHLPPTVPGVVFIQLHISNNHGQLLWKRHGQGHSRSSPVSASTHTDPA